MAKEIERKFLVNECSMPALHGGFRISQGYIKTQDKTAVRVRVKNELAYLTLKGESNGMTCSEFEYSIPLNDAKDILEELCSGSIIEKTRYEISHGSHLWEVDIFHGENTGLIVAEVELSKETEAVDLPKWVAEEVTGQDKYFNASLVEFPFSQWK